MRVLTVGGGIGGLALAAALRRSTSLAGAGSFRPIVFEQAPETEFERAWSFELEKGRMP